MKERKIGMLGTGNMAGAMIRGLLSSGTLSPDQIRGSDLRAEHLAELERSYGIKTHTSNAELLAWANVIVLAVKPQGIDKVLDQVAGELNSDTLVISIAAGVLRGLPRLALVAGPLEDARHCVHSPGRTLPQLSRVVSIRGLG